MSKFRKTEVGIQICPFFVWQSEQAPHHESSVAISVCVHKDNLAGDVEGNCQECNCPLMKL